MKINVEETRTGRPCVWEEGGGRTRSGHAVLVTDSKGEPLKPLYVQGKGIRVCSKHALMPLVEGGYVIAVEYKGPQGLLEVYQAVLCEESPGLELQLVQSVDGLQDPPQGILPSFLYKAVSAAWRKARMYHCRSVTYVP